jgi:hypothetical protein
MQSDQVLLQILKRLETPDPESLLFGANEVCKWPDEWFASLVTSGLIKPASPAKLTECNGCEENCLMPVNILPDTGNWPARFFISCDKLENVGRIPVNPADLSQFQIDVDQTIRLLAKAFGSAQSPDEIRKGRMYRITNAVLAGKKRAIFFMRGATWPDGMELLGGLALEFEASPSPLILVPNELPPPGDRMHYAFVSLAHLTSVEQEGLVLDQNELLRRISKGQGSQDRTVVPFAVAPGAKWKELLISFVNEETVKIAVRGNVEHRTFREMGFMDARKKEETPDRLWSVLLWMAKHHGDIDWTDSSAKLHDPKLMKKRISEIRKKLKAVFPGIPGDPFHPYEKVKRYQTRFILSALPSAFQPR